jgi:C4-dicarboxylate-binding protein DctP
MDKLEPKGITGLAFWDNGFHMMTGNRPMHGATDFQGMKIRISGSKIADQYFRKVGAIPQILAFSEVYQAMQTGVVDGGENTPSNIYTQKFFEVQPHISSADHAHLQYAVIANAKFWAGLPSDIKPQVDKAMKEATDFANTSATQDNIDALAAIQKTGKVNYHVVTPAERKTWMDAMMPVHEWAVSRCGREVVDLLHKEAGFHT